jgi:hypothetical protein
VSYVWGSSEDPSYAYIHDNETRITPITRNIDIALRRLRDESRTRVIWVDALCINQRDTIEKSRQVALMGDIYSLASCVLMWLGPEEDGSDDALKLLESLGEEIEVDWNDGHMRASSHCTNVEWADTTIPLPFMNGELNSVLALFARPYFRRAWIRQEIALAEEATVYCGLRTMPLETFQRAIVCLREKTFYEEAVELGKWHRLRDYIQVVHSVCRTGHVYVHFTSLRYTQRTAECQDDRDRIYAILSLLNDQDQHLDIKPNYDLPAEHLFTDVVRRILIRKQSLSFLDSCHPASNALNLPTWVPDWSICSPVTRLAQSEWSACGWISAYARIDGDRMYASGVSKAQVRTVIDLKVAEVDEPHDITLHLLRALKPAQGLPDIKTLEGQATLLKYSLALTSFTLSEPEFTSHELMKILDQVWASTATWAKLEEEFPGNSPLSIFLSACYHAFIGYCFFSASDGLVGLSPVGTQEGDTVCVFLGCRYPITLHQALGTGKTPLWQVVGPAVVPGLMHGEAIYRDRLPKSYKPVWVAEHSDLHVNLIDEYDYALHDTAKDVMIVDPASVLEEVGIKVESYQRYPHKLVVSSQALQAADVAIEEFALI